MTQGLERILSIGSLILLLSASAGSNAYAQVVGSLDAVTGHVAVTELGQTPHAVRRGDAVSVGDVLETSNGKADIRFFDGGKMTMGSATQLRIDSYQDGKESESSTTFGLMKGVLRSVTGSIGKIRPAAFLLTTPTGQIGVRGTEFVVQEKAGLRVGVISGVVEVKNERETSVIKAGQQVRILNQSAPHVKRSKFDSRMRGLIHASRGIRSSHSSRASKGTKGTKGSKASTEHSKPGHMSMTGQHGTNHSRD